MLIGFLNKIDELKNTYLIGKDKPDIFAITEVLPKNSQYSFNLNKAKLDFNYYELFPSNFLGNAK